MYHVFTPYQEPIHSLLRIFLNLNVTIEIGDAEEDIVVTHPVLEFTYYANVNPRTGNFTLYAWRQWQWRWR